MIQPINESEKNRIRNLHRKHFILNEEETNGDCDKFINGRVGCDNYKVISKIANKKGMTISSTTPSMQNGGIVFWKWTKDLGNGNQLVLIILNSGYKIGHGGVTVYIDRDGGKYAKPDGDKLVKTGEGSRGTIPTLDTIYQLGLDNGTQIKDRQNDLKRIETALTKLENGDTFMFQL